MYSNRAAPKNDTDEQVATGMQTTAAGQLAQTSCARVSFCVGEEVNYGSRAHRLRHWGFGIYALGIKGLRASGSAAETLAKSWALYKVSTRESAPSQQATASAMFCLTRIEACEVADSSQGQAYTGGVAYTKARNICTLPPRAPCSRQA